MSEAIRILEASVPRRLADDQEVVEAMRVIALWRRFKHVAPTWDVLWQGNDLLGNCSEEFDGGPKSPDYRVRRELPPALREMFWMVVDLGSWAAAPPAGGEAPLAPRHLARLRELSQLVGDDSV